jgi:hypothetical protein
MNQNDLRFLNYLKNQLNPKLQKMQMNLNDLRYLSYLKSLLIQK